MTSPSAPPPVFVPFSFLTLSFDANFVIKADSLGPTPYRTGDARLKWAPASPDAPFNNGGR